jgi:hypothetical protein
MHHMRHLTITSLFALTACVSWRPIASVQPGELPPRQEYRLATHGHFYRLHALRWGADSVSGVPYLQPPSCDSCRLAFSTREIEGIQVQQEAHVRTTLFVLAAAAIAGFLLVESSTQ